MKFWKMNLKLVYIYIYIYIYIKPGFESFRNGNLKNYIQNFQNFGILREMEFWKTYLKLVFKKTGFGILEI